MPPTRLRPHRHRPAAIVALLTTNEPLFIAAGTRLFTSFAAILIAWYGIRWMLGGHDSGRLFGFAKLLVIAFGYTMIPAAVTTTRSGGSTSTA